MKPRSRAGGEAIKGRRRKTPKPKRNNAPKAVARSISSSVGKETEVARLGNELREALEQQTATSEVLRIISSSPGDPQPVFATMLQNAVQICDASFGSIYRWDDEALRLVATHNTPPAFAEARRRSPSYCPYAKTPLGRMIATKTLVQVADLAAEEGYIERRDPGIVEAAELGGVRAALIVPMLKENELVGALVVQRQEVRPFTDKQIELVQNFASQAVIAIENTRLLNELRQSLEQQTATSEVLQVISSSPGDLEPVFAAMLENAVRICDATFGNIYRGGGATVCVSLRPITRPLPSPKNASAHRIGVSVRN